MPHSETRLQAALALSGRPTDTFLELTRCLAAGYREDPAFIAAYIQTSRIGRRKVYYLLELGKRLDDLGVTTPLSD